MHKLLTAARAGQFWGLLCTLYYGHAIMQSLVAKLLIQKCGSVTGSCNIGFGKHVPSACLVVAPMTGG